jgi:hypothetical protein
MLNKQILNIFSKISTLNHTSKINLAYESDVSLFDKIMNDLDICNLVSKEAANLPGIPINGIIINNPVDFAQKLGDYQNFAASSRFLFYHFLPPPNLKKEDISILGGNLSSCYKVSFLGDSSSWLIPDMVHLDYGVPSDIISNILSKYKSKDILVLNLNNNSQSDIIHKQVETAFPTLSVDCFKDYSMSMKDIIDIISEYKIVIDIHSAYNQLISLCCGSIVVSGNTSINNAYLRKVSHSKEIVESIAELLNSYNTEQLSKNAEDLINRYDLNKFKTNMTQILLT